MSSQIAKRDRELTQIAKSISELADLFQDLSNMVVEQGTVLDCVEYNVEQTNTYVQEAGQELKVAENYQRRTGRRKCICFLILVIVGLVIVLIYKPRGHASRTVGTPVSAGGRPQLGTGAVDVDAGMREPEVEPTPTPTRYDRPVRPSRITTLASALPSMGGMPGQGRPPPIRPPSRPGVPVRPPRPRPKPHRPTSGVPLD
jgi:syntaxin 16